LEVKGERLGKKQIDKENEDFNNINQRKRIQEILGHTNYDKYIFCWGVNEETKRYAEEKYQIHIVPFWKIVNHLIDRVRDLGQKDRYRYERGIEYPNLMLLQMLYHYSKTYKGKTRIDLNQLQKP